MRRGLSILLALVFGLGPLSSALPGAEDANLPACCRRDGAHHCAMAARMAAEMAAMSAAVNVDGKTSVSAPTTCPYYPGLRLALLMPAHALLAAAKQLHISATTALALLPEDSANLQGCDRTCTARGPPASLPS